VHLAHDILRYKHSCDFKTFYYGNLAYNIVEKPTTIINVCHIHHLSRKKIYEVLFKRPFSQTWPKTRKTIGTALRNSHTK